MSLLRVIGLTAGYERNVVITDVFINVNKGEIVAILGPNGSGKSTLLKSIMGLTKVFSGKIFFRGIDLTPLGITQRVKMGISYVPQLDNIFTELSVEENLEMGAYIRSDKENIKRDIDDIYNLFPELKERRREKAKTLSGGERQILAIARALIMRPILLILDEPTANLASKVISTLTSKIKEVNNEGVTVLIAEQNVRFALSVTDKVYVMRSGRVIFKGLSQNLTRTTIENLFLGKSPVLRH